MIQRWDDLTPEEQQRFLSTEELLQQLAAATARAEAAEAQIGQVIYLLCNYGQTDGAHHKAWVIDQVARELLGDGYDKWVANMAADGLTWDTGIAPR